MPAASCLGTLVGVAKKQVSACSTTKLGGHNFYMVGTAPIFSYFFLQKLTWFGTLFVDI